MAPRWGTALFVAFVGFSLVVLVRAVTGADVAAAPPTVGMVAPDFTLRLFDGGTFRLADARGSVVVLNFWASWCGPCRAEAPVLERAWRRYRDRGVLLVGVNVQDRPEAARAFAAEFQKTYPLGVDPAGRIEVVYGLTGLPETFFIDRSGRIVYKFVGPLDDTRLDGILEKLLD